MSVSRARVLYCAVQRKQLFQAHHPEVTITLEYAPLWHWAASLPDGRTIVNHELDLLLDELTETLDPNGRLPG